MSHFPQRENKQKQETLSEIALTMEREMDARENRIADLLRELEEAETRIREPMMTIEDVAEHLQVSTSWVRTRLVRKTDPIPHFNDGVIRINRDALAGWIERNSNHAATVQKLSTLSPVSR